MDDKRKNEAVSLQWKSFFVQLLLEMAAIVSAGYAVGRSIALLLIVLEWGAPMSFIAENVGMILLASFAALILWTLAQKKDA